MPSYGTLFEGFNSLTGWSLQTGAGTSQSLDTTNFIEGTASLKLTATNGAIAFTRKTINQSFANVKTFLLRFYVDNADNVNEVTLYFTHDGFTSTIWKKLGVNTVVSGWNEALLDVTTFTTSTGESFSNTMNGIQLRIGAKAGTDLNVSFDALYYQDTLVNRPKLLFTFDDGWDSQYNVAYQYMSPYGLRGNIAVIPSLVNTSGYMTLAQLQEVYTAGWDLANHTYDHINLKTEPDPAKKVKEIEDGRAWLIQNGFHRAADILVYPQGGYDQTVLNYLATTHRGARTVTEHLEYGTPIERFKVKIRNCINTIDINTAKGWVDEAIRTGGTLLLLFHKLVTNPTVSTEFSISSFQQLVDYVASKLSQIDVITYDELFASFKGARVQIPQTPFDHNGAVFNINNDANLVNGGYFTNTGHEYLLVENPGPNTVVVAVDYKPDKFGRSGLKAHSIPAGQKRVIGPFMKELYNQADGQVYVRASAPCKFTVIQQV